MPPVAIANGVGSKMEPVVVRKTVCFNRQEVVSATSVAVTISMARSLDHMKRRVWRAEQEDVTRCVLQQGHHEEKSCGPLSANWQTSVWLAPRGGKKISVCVNPPRGHLIHCSYATTIAKIRIQARINLSEWRNL